MPSYRDRYFPTYKMDILQQNPYQQNLEWIQIEKWRMLDFVKALPQTHLMELEKLPDYPETTHEWCHINQRVMPRLHPERCKSHFLKKYNDLFEPLRVRRREAATMEERTESLRRIELYLAGIKENFERSLPVLARQENILKEIDDRLSRLEIWHQESSVAVAFPYKP